MAQLALNGQAFALTPASLTMRQPSSLAPDYAVSIPDLSKVQPNLIGPITDSLTFYADVQLAMRQRQLVGAGDHVYFKRDIPNSWADGHRIVLGEDAIEFDITLQTVDNAAGVATLVVRHLPLAQLHVKLPAAWMLTPVAALPNNRVQIEKDGGGKFIAGVGVETLRQTSRLRWRMVGSSQPRWANLSTCWSGDARTPS